MRAELSDGDFDAEIGLLEAQRTEHLAGGGGELVGGLGAGGAEGVGLLAQVFLHLGGLGLQFRDAGFDVALRGEPAAERLALLADGVGARTILTTELQPEVHLPVEFGGGFVVAGEPATQTREIGADVLRFRGERVQAVAQGGSFFVDAGDVVAGLEELRQDFTQPVGAETGLELAKQGSEFLGARGTGVVAFELGDGLFGEVERIKFLQLGAEEGFFVFGEAFGRGGFDGFAEQLVTLTPARAVGRERGGQAGVQVEHLELRLGAHQLLRFARAVEIDPQLAELLELREGRRTAVDGDAARLGGVDGTLEDEQPVVAGRQVEGLQRLVETLVAVGLELRFDRALFGALADDRLRRAITGEERERAEQHRFAGAGLARDHGEARAQFERGAVHQGEVADLEAADHAEGRLPNKAEPTRTQVEPAATADSRSPLIPIDNSGSATPKRAARASRQRRSSAKVRSATAGSSDSGAMAIRPLTTSAGWAKAASRSRGASARSQPNFAGSSPELTWMSTSRRRPISPARRPSRVASSGESTLWMTSKACRACLALLDWRWPISSQRRSAGARGRFWAASWTRFSPTARRPKP